MIGAELIRLTHRDIIATRLRSLVVAIFMSGCDGTPAPPPPPVTPFKPVADVKQLMVSVLEPAADVYWDAVGTVVDAKGTVEFAPKTDAEWNAVRNSAFVIAESGNLLMMGGRARDGAEWMAMAKALVDAGQRALQAAQRRDKDSVFDVGAQVYDACTQCHAKYAVPLQQPNARDK